MKQEKKILYISYDGLLEPLGQSQILSYLKNLSSNFIFFLITFEKKNDWNDIENVKKIKQIVDKSNIYWIPLSYTSKPYVISTLIDISKAILKSFFLIHQKKIKIIHARGYIAGLIAYLLRLFTNIKFIFDMRGFWADERLEWGIWKRKNLIYYLFKYLENLFFKKSDAVVSLTKVGVDEILSNLNEIDSNKFYVIPTCTDLDLFYPKSSIRNKKFIITHLGAIGTRYHFKKVLEFFLIMDSLISSELLIINKGEHDLIKKLLDQFSIDSSKYKILKTQYYKVPYYINQSSIGVFFPKEGYYLNGYFPTKLGEFLGCGKPIVCGNINKDVEEIITKNDIGIIIDNKVENKNLLNSCKKIIKIKKDKRISNRCRLAAKSHFSSFDGSKKYSKIYNNLF
tara:strand:+ start:9327 stop:10517 length:1191 start_codon:yes stop_codon:yes gene_type:complete